MHSWINQDLPLLKAGLYTICNVTSIGLFPVLNQFSAINGGQAIQLLSLGSITVNYKNLTNFYS